MHSRIGPHLAKEILVAAIDAAVRDVVSAPIGAIALVPLILTMFVGLITGQYIQVDEPMIMSAADHQIATIWIGAAPDAMRSSLIHLASCKRGKKHKIKY